MVPLEMRVFGYVWSRGEHRPRPDCSTWRIGSVNMESCTFPSDDRIIALFQEHLGKVLVVLERFRHQSNSVMVEIPHGTTPRERLPFLEALAKETVFI